MTLRQRVFRAGAWTLASYGVEISTKFISNLIMTRLLFPDAFGLIAAAMALIVGLQLLSDFGVRAVIIQSVNGDEPTFLRSAWVFQASRGLMLWIILIIVCGLMHLDIVRSLFAAQSIFADPSFPIVTGALGLNLLFGGLESTAISLNLRKLNFKPIVCLDLTARIVPLPIMIAWAFMAPSVWAIVVGTLLGGFIRAALSHIVVPGPPMFFSWRPQDTKQIVDFGKWVNLSSVATFFGSQSDVLILGLIMPGPVLGIYYIAKMLADNIEALLERINSSMSLSVLGEVIRTNPGNLSDRYYQFRLPIELVAAGAAGFLFSAGNLVVNFLYDTRYSDAGTILKILSFGLLLYPFQLIRSAFTAVAKTNVVAWISVLQAVSLIICLTSGYYFAGSLGAIAGVVASRIFPSAAIICLAYREGWLNFWGEFRCIPIYALGLAVGKAAVLLLGSYTTTPLRQFFH